VNLEFLNLEYERAVGADASCIPCRSKVERRRSGFPANFTKPHRTTACKRITTKSPQFRVGGTSPRRRSRGPNWHSNYYRVLDCMQSNRFVSSRARHGLGDGSRSVISGPRPWNSLPPSLIISAIGREFARPPRTVLDSEGADDLTSLCNTCFASWSSAPGAWLPASVLDNGKDPVFETQRGSDRGRKITVLADRRHYLPMF
jgi:hypothetical protein